MKSKILTIVLLCLVSSGCVIWPFPHQESETPRIVGQVIDDESGLPLEGVTLTSESTMEIEGVPSAITEANSDAEGKYVLEQVYRSRDTRVFFFIGDMFGHCKAKVSATIQGYEQKIIEVRGPLRSSHFNSVCDSIDDIEVTIRLKREKI